MHQPLTRARAGSALCGTAPNDDTHHWTARRRLQLRSPLFTDGLLRTCPLSHSHTGSWLQPMRCRGCCTVLCLSLCRSARSQALTYSWIRIWHKWQLTVACLFMQRETHTPLIPSSCLTGLFCFSRLLLVLKPPLRQCRFFLTGLEKQASELPGLCMLGFLFFVCVHVWQSFRQESCVLSSSFCFCFERPQLQVLDGFHLLLSSIL